ncbi:DUF3348 domain-containing protein [Variovorax sp. E3]|uniref:DUF3348 domain-containing protein n=1 Tax=Variovorax sp. E3 TaxID=1914993 RepID=UPI0018DC93EF|nr:DUF3348 domain-containing protein [Variovorax sp. E3]
MVQVTRRTGFTGSPLVRLLSRLTDGDVAQPRQTTAERLSQWFGWTDDISLSAALNGGPASSLSSARNKVSATAEEAECARVRAALTKTVSSDSAAPRTAPNDTAADFAPLRQRYLARQQAMEVAIAPLRSRLRTTLAGRSQAMAKLAAVDVVMEQVLAVQERSLLSGVPALLEKHFKRLRQAALEAQAEAEAAAAAAETETPTAPDAPGNTAAPLAWQDVFHKDLQDVLLAELDFRFQPVEGLLEALRMKQPG